MASCFDNSCCEEINGVGSVSLILSALAFNNSAINFEMVLLSMYFDLNLSVNG